MKLNVLFTLLILLGLAGCKPKEIPTLQRKEAATLASEAQFAVTLRDYARAEPLLEKAAKLCPDMGDYWLNLGATRRHLGNKSGTKVAYEKALEAYRQNAKVDKAGGEPLLQEVYVLALLGRANDARSALEKAQKKMPNDRAVRLFVEGKQLDRLLADPAFKEMSL